jgi:hypothetical protein
LENLAPENPARVSERTGARLHPPQWAKAWPEVWPVRIKLEFLAQNPV